MALTPTQEKQVVIHLTSKSNPHAVTYTQTGVRSTDDLLEGNINKFQHLYTVPPVIKQQLLDAGFSLPVTTTDLSFEDTMTFLFDLIIQGKNNGSDT